MTTLSDRPNTALLVIDVQNGVVAERPRARRGGRQHQHARRQGPRQGVPVVWVQHSDEHLAQGSDAWQYVPELSPR